MWEDSENEISSPEQNQANNNPAEESVLKTPTELETGPKLLTIKVLAETFGLTVGSIYSMIRADSTFPYINVGLKKKFMVSPAEFQKWIEKRTDQEKAKKFSIPSSESLLKIFKDKKNGPGN